jgi:integrase
MKPPARRMRAHRASQPEKYWEAEEIRKIVACSPQPMKSFVLLGINCAFNPSDCGTLPLEAIDFEGGWIDYTRPKTAFPRKAKLWPETIESIQEWLSVRPETLEYEHLTFVTKYRNPWHRENSAVKHSAVSTSFAKICEKNKIARKGRSFGALRHTFKTRAEDIDAVAAKYVCGHASTTDAESIEEIYRQFKRFDPQRFIRVADAMHDWYHSSQST